MNTWFAKLLYLILTLGFVFAANAATNRAYIVNIRSPGSVTVADDAQRAAKDLILTNPDGKRAILRRAFTVR